MKTSPSRFGGSRDRALCSLRQSAATARILRHIVAQCSGGRIDESSRERDIATVVVTCDMLVLSANLDDAHLV